jgi:hypothetical protein
MDMTKLKPALVLILAVAFAFSPLLSPGFGGYDPAQFPVQIARPAILPAGYAFAIWGMIYLWLIAHAGYGLFRRADDADWDATRWPLIVSLGVGTVWLSVAMQSPVWASVLIAVMLASALLAVWHTGDADDRWPLTAPLAIYAGWLTAATGVSFGVLVSGFGWLPDTWAAVVFLALVLGVALTVQRHLARAPEYGLTVIWALAAVVVSNGTANLPIALLAAAAAAVMALAAWRSHTS